MIKSPPPEKNVAFRGKTNFSRKGSGGGEIKGFFNKNIYPLNQYIKMKCKISLNFVNIFSDKFFFPPFLSLRASWGTGGGWPARPLGVKD